MKTPLRRAIECATFLASLWATPFLTAQTRPFVVPTNTLTTAPYSSTGILFTEFGPNRYRGSAAVARDARLLYTCAHVIYDDGIWTSSGDFGRGWSSPTRPTSTNLVRVRGYRYFATYSGGNSERAFSRDFAIGFRNATTNFGPPLPVMTNGGEALRDPTVPKLIVGYPAQIDYTGGSGYYYMHRTGPYTYPMTRVRDSYHTVDTVSTGGGNSGGPVLADTGTGYELAGILISGNYNSAGVYGIDSAATTMADSLIAALDGVTAGDLELKTATNTDSTRLPDASKKYTSRKLKISGLGPTAVSTVLNLRITTPFRGDLDVYVRSPSGRIHWVHQHALNRPGRDMVLRNANYDFEFFGVDANGNWNLYMRDFYQYDTASFKKASLTVGTVPSTPPPLVIEL